MKYYVKPSLEVSKFDVEDIITVSGEGVQGTAGAASDASKSVYNEFLGTTAGAGGLDAENLVEFEW